MNKQILITVTLVLIIVVAFAFVYFSAADRNNLQLISETISTEVVQQNRLTKNSSATSSDTTYTITKSPTSLSGTCVKGVFHIPGSLLTLVETKSGYSVTSASFSCVLSNRTFITGGEGQFWSHNFKVIQFDESGKLLNIFLKNNGNASGGEFNVSNVINGVFSVSHHVTDPCYDATFTFTFNLNTGKYAEATKGGDDAKCWEKLNARGGV